jgi:predicted secreted Zn-dependent protease
MTWSKSSGPAPIFTRREWDAFLTGAKNGEFDHGRPRNLRHTLREL